MSLKVLLKRVENLSFFLKIGFWLIIAANIRQFVPMKYWHCWLGTINQETPLTDLSLSEEIVIERLKKMLRLWKKLCPLFGNCLIQSISSKFILQQENIASTLYLCASTRDKSGSFSIKPHAWLRAGNTTVISKSVFQKNLIAFGII